MANDLVLFSSAIKDNLNEFKQYAARKKVQNKVLRHPHMRQILARLDAIPSLGEVNYLGVFQGYSTDPLQQIVEFSVTLKDDVKDPQFPRDLIRSGIAKKLMKRVGYGGSSLTIRGELFTDLALAFKVKIQIEGYVPATCKVIYEDVVIPEHTERKAKVICGPTEMDASATGTDLEEEVTA